MPKYIDKKKLLLIKVKKNEIKVEIAIYIIKIKISNNILNNDISIINLQEI